MNIHLLPGHSDAAVEALSENGTPTERIAAKTELAKRGMDYHPEQYKMNRKPRPFVPTEGGWGWGARG